MLYDNAIFSFSKSIFILSTIFLFYRQSIYEMVNQIHRWFFLTSCRTQSKYKTFSTCCSLRKENIFDTAYRNIPLELRQRLADYLEDKAENLCIEGSYLFMFTTQKVLGLFLHFSAGY